MGGKHLSHAFHNIETFYLTNHDISLITVELFDLKSKVDLMKSSCRHKVFQIEDF